jgi:hypothetical protein
MNPLLPSEIATISSAGNTPFSPVKEKVRLHLTSPESKSSARLSTFLDLNLNFPKEFPFENYDPAAIERLRWVLGLPQLAGSNFHEEPYIIKNRRANTWLEWVQDKIGFENVLEWYLVGSSACFVSGKKKLIEGLQFLQTRLPETLFQDTLRKLEKWNGSFNDIDFKLKVKESVDLEILGKELNKLNMVEASYKIESKTLLIRVKDPNGHGVDLYVYSDLPDDHALNTDNWRINLKMTVLEPSGHNKTVNEIIQYESSNPWSWWLGQVFKVIEKKETTNRYIFPRLVDRQVRAHIACIGTESVLFNAWNLNEYQKDDDTSVKNLFRKLRIQHIALDHRKSVDINYLSNQTSQAHAKVIRNRFLQTVFSALHEKRAELVPYMHAILECIALIALCEGWDRPFGVKLVKNEGKWMMRMRLEGCDLLLKFNPEDSLSKLPNPHSAMWPHLKKVMHSLWLDGMHSREVTKEYRKQIEKHVNNKLLKRIKQQFLHDVSMTVDEKVVMSNQNTLADYLIPMCSDPNELFWLGMEVLTEYDQNSRQKLCWLAVENCLKYHGCDKAAELISRLRDEEIEPESGYELFFMECIRGNNNEAVLKAINPLSVELKWLELAKKDAKVTPIQKLLQMIDNSAMPAEEYLRTVKSSRAKPKVVSEPTLIKILNHLEPKNASEWIQKYDKPLYNSDEYKGLVSKLIFNRSATLPPSWILAFLNSGRFFGDSVTICTFMLSQNISTDEKSELLRLFKIQEMNLWQQIAGEYLQKTGIWPPTFMESSGIPYDVLANWCTVINHASNTDVVIPLLKQLKDTHRLKGIVLLHLLKEWGKRSVDPAVLVLLDPGMKKLPWKEIVAGATNGKDILSKLKDPKVVSQESYPTLFDLYYSLMHAINTSEEHYVTFMIEFLEKFDLEKALSYCKKRQFKECLMIKPKLALNFLKRITSPEMIGFVLEVANKKDYIDEELFKLLLFASFQLNYNGATTENIIDSSPKVKIRDVSDIQKIRTQAINLLENPKGNLNAVVQLWNLLPIDTQWSCLASSHRLMGLIKNGHIHLVIKMLNDSSDEDRKKIDPKLYCEILRLIKTPEEKIVLLTSCQVTSNTLKKIWKELSFDPEISRDIFSKLRLIPIGLRLEVEITSIQNVAMGVLSSIRPDYVINQELIVTIHNLLELAEPQEKVRLWIALKNTKRMPPEKLWVSGCVILQEHLSQPPLSLVGWLINNRRYGQEEVLWPLIPHILPKLPEDLVQKYVNGFVKKAAVRGNVEAKDVFWKYTTGTDLTNDEMEALQPTPEQKVLIVDKLILNCIVMPSTLEKITTTLNLCERYSDCWLNNFDMIHRMSLILTDVSQRIGGEMKQKLLTYLTLCLTNPHGSIDGWRILLDNFEYLSTSSVQLIRTYIQSDQLLKNDSSHLKRGIFQAIIKLKPEQRMKFEGIMTEVATTDKERAVFKLTALKENLTILSSTSEAMSYTRYFKHAIENNDFGAVSLFLPPFLEYILTLRRPENVAILKAILICIEGDKSSIIATAEILSVFKSSADPQILFEALTFIFKSISSELEVPIKKERLAAIYEVLEICAFLIYTEDSLLLFVEPLKKARDVLAAKSDMLLDIRPMYILTLLLQCKFNYYVKPAVEIDCISYALKVLVSMNTRTAIDTVQHLMCDMTYRLLYAYPEALASCHGEMIKGTLKVYNTLDSFRTVYKLLFKHLLQPPGNDTDRFLKEKPATGKSTHHERLKMIQFTVTHLLIKYPKILPDLINFIHSDIVHLFDAKENQIWENVAVLLNTSCSEQECIVSRNTLALLLVTRPCLRLELEGKSDRNAAATIAYDLSNGPIPLSDKYYFSFFTFSHHIKRCESEIAALKNCVSKENNLSQYVKHLITLFANFKSCIDNFNTEVVIFTSQKRLFNAIQEILSILQPLIINESAIVIFYIAKLIEMASSLHPAYQFNLAMAIAKIYRKELAPIRGKLTILGGENATQIQAEMMCQLMNYDDLSKCSSYSYPFELLEPFVNGNFRDFIQHHCTSPIYTSIESRSKFFAVYVAVLNGLFERLKANGDKPEFISQLLFFRKHTDTILEKCGNTFCLHLKMLFDLIESNSSLLNDKELCEGVLNLLIFNIKNTDSSHLTQDKIFEFIGRFATLAFVYGPDYEDSKAPNIFQKEVFKLANQLCLEIYYPEKGIGRTEEACMYLGVLDFLENKFIRYPPKYKKASLKYLHDSLVRYHNQGMSDWFNFWHLKISNLCLIEAINQVDWKKDK